MLEINEILSVVADPRMGLAALAAFLSFIVQGYSGFGGGIIVVPILAFIFGPVEAVAINVIPSFLANISLVPSLVKDTNWRELRPLLVGVLFTIPIGLLFLVSVEPEIIRKGMGVFIILIALLLISGWRYTGKREGWVGVGVGALGGAIIGGFGIPSGPIMVAYIMSSKDAPNVQRATIAVLVVLTITILLFALIAGGIFTSREVVAGFLLIPLYVGGAWLGKKIFELAPASWFKKITFSLLFLTGVSTLLL